MPLVLALEGVLHDDVGLSERPLDVAALDGDGDHGVVLVLVVDLRRPVGHGRSGVEDGGELLVGDLDEVDGGSGGLLVDGGDGRDLIAHVADLVRGERHLVLDEGTPAALEGVLGGHHGPYAGQRLGSGGVDAQDAGVRVGAAEDLAGERAWRGDVGDVFGTARDFLEALDPWGGLPDDRQLVRLRHGAPFG